MNPSILQKLSAITEEEQEILNGRESIDRDLYMDGSRDVINGKKLLHPGQLIAVRPHTRFIAFPEHTHDYVEMVYMCQGETRHTINGKELVLKEGDLLMLGQFARQSIQAAGKDDIAINFIVRPSFFAETLPYFGDEKTPLREFIVDCLTGMRNSDSLLFRVGDVIPVQNLLENLTFTLLEPVPNKRRILQSTMGLMFSMLLNYTDRLEMDSEKQDVIIAVLRYIETHYQDGSLTEVADQLHYETSSLSKLILRMSGQNYTDLVQQKRLSQAAWLLKNTKNKVEDIAGIVGYENVSYFHRLFTAEFGCTPKKYRESQ